MVVGTSTRPEIGSEVSEEVYDHLALAEPDRDWELHDGRLREKPGMTFAHNRLAFRLAFDLQSQLGWDDYVVGHDAGRLRLSPKHAYIPDVFVVRAAQAEAFRGRQNVLEAYQGPALLVVEVWSPSTGDYDVESKLAQYQQRGDEEIWYLHPYDRVLTVWRRQSDGSYVEEIHREGVVRPSSLPGVAIDLEWLFAVL